MGSGYDLLGAEDILGAGMFGTRLAGGRDRDLAELLAGAEGGGVDQGMTQQAALQQLALRGGMAVVPRAYNRGRTFYQGFGPTVIAAAGTANVIVQPQVTFKPNRLTIPSDIAGAIQINDLRIGQASQFPSSNAVPGRVFTEFAVDSTVNFDTAQISQQISLNVTNTSGAAVTFTAALRGMAAL